MPKQDLSNEQHLLGPTSDPQKRLSDAYKVVYLVAGLNTALGLISFLFKPELLQQFGFGVGSLLFGLVSLPLGYFVQRKSTTALILAIVILILDGCVAFYLVILQGYEINATAVVLMHYFFLLPMFQDLRATRTRTNSNTEANNVLQAIKPLGNGRTQQKPNTFVKILLYSALGLLVPFYLILLAGTTYEAIVFPKSPQRVTLGEAVKMHLQNKPAFLFFEKALYVSITDAKWECASIKQVDVADHEDDHTDGVFSNANHAAFVFVQIHGLYSCQELQKMEIAGKLQRFTKRPVEFQSDTQGTVIIDNASEAVTFELCTHCTPSEARLFPVFCLFWPFVMWGIFEYGRRQQQKQSRV